MIIKNFRKCKNERLLYNIIYNAVYFDEYDFIHLYLYTMYHPNLELIHEINMYALIHHKYDINIITEYLYRE